MVNKDECMLCCPSTETLSRQESASLKWRPTVLAVVCSPACQEDGEYSRAGDRSEETVSRFAAVSGEPAVG
jgi:hypothetical protein